MTFTERSENGYLIPVANLAVDSFDLMATVPAGVPVYWSGNQVVIAGANEVAVCAEPRTAGVHPATCTHTPIPAGASVVGSVWRRSDLIRQDAGMELDTFRELVTVQWRDWLG